MYTGCGSLSLTLKEQRCDRGPSKGRMTRWAVPWLCRALLTWGSNFSASQQARRSRTQSWGKESRTQGRIDSVPLSCVWKDHCNRCSTEWLSPGLWLVWRSLRAKLGAQKITTPGQQLQTLSELSGGYVTTQGTKSWCSDRRWSKPTGTRCCTCWETERRRWACTRPVRKASVGWSCRIFPGAEWHRTKRLKWPDWCTRWWWPFFSFSIRISRSLMHFLQGQ